MISIRIRRVRAHAEPIPLPEYQTADSAGMDLRADIEGELTLAPFERRAVPTGIVFALPRGYEGQIRPRSGLALKHGVTCLNAPGTVDADYRGEVMVILANLSQQPFVIRRADRIAQLVVAPVTRAAWFEVKELDETERGAGGFGSTGQK